jgi:hypothetical protein
MTRRLLTAAAAGLLIATVLLFILGPGRRCDRTPPCPPGANCITVRIVGPCPVTISAVVVAILVGAGGAGATLVLTRSRRP